MKKLYVSFLLCTVQIIISNYIPERPASSLTKLTSLREQIQQATTSDKLINIRDEINILMQLCSRKSANLQQKINFTTQAQKNYFTSLHPYNQPANKPHLFDGVSIFTQQILHYHKHKTLIKLDYDDLLLTHQMLNVKLTKQYWQHFVTQKIEQQRRTRAQQALTEIVMQKAKAQSRRRLYKQLCKEEISSKKFLSDIDLHDQQQGIFNNPIHGAEYLIKELSDLIRYVQICEDINPKLLERYYNQAKLINTSLQQIHHVPLSDFFEFETTTQKNLLSAIIYQHASCKEFETEDTIKKKIQNCKKAINKGHSERKATHQLIRENPRTRTLHRQYNNILNRIESIQKEQSQYIKKLENFMIKDWLQKIQTLITPPTSR